MTPPSSDCSSTQAAAGEIAALRLSDVDLDGQVIHVVGKGSRVRVVPFGAKTARALGRYLRLRDRDRWSHSDALWLAEKGRAPLGADGIRQVLEGRSQAAGLPGLHAHQSRHTAAQRWNANGGGETDLMRLMGWRSPQMLRRDAATTASTGLATSRPPRTPRRSRWA